MSVATIIYLGVSKTLANWGVEDAVFTHRAGGDDTLTFSVVEALGAAKTFAQLETIELFQPNGRRVFRGVVMKARRRASGDGEIRRFYACVSPSYYLRKTFVHQEWRFLITGSIDIEEISTALLGRQRARNEIVSAVQDAIDAGAPITLETDHLPPDDAADRNPEDRQRALTCNDAIAKVLGWWPHMGWRWYYDGISGEDVEMQCFSCLRASQAATYGLEANHFDARTVSAEAVEEFDADPRYDLLEGSVKVRSITRTEVEIEGDPYTVREISEQVATASPSNDAFGAFEMDLELRPARFDGSAYTDGEAAVAGLATRLGAAYFHLWHDLAFTKMGTACDYSIVPGVLWSIDDADSEYAAAQAVCQEVIHDIQHGTTTVRCGPPDQLGLRDPLRLLNRLRNVPTRGDASQQDYGFEPPGEEDDAGLQITIRYCDGGTEHEAVIPAFSDVIL